jgi:pimeloyl-ACP methyl ester carboxylesterase
VGTASRGRCNNAAWHQTASTDPAGRVALIARGDCTFAEKYLAAADAGADDDRRLVEELLASPKEQAVFIARFIDAIGLERPLLVGHSLGGAVALATALDHSDKISGLALISPLTQREDEVAPEFAPLEIGSPLRRRLFAHTLAVPGAIRHGARTLAYVFGPQEPPADYAVAGGAMSALTPEHFFASSTDFRAVKDVMGEQQERYGELGLPVGVIFGTADRVIDWERHGKGVAGKIRDLDFEPLEGIGHMPQFVATDRVEAFIRRIAARAYGGR